MTTGQTPDPTPTCDRCHEPLTEHEIALSWPLHVPTPGRPASDCTDWGQDICPSCYEDGVGEGAFCRACGALLAADDESGRCPSVYRLRVADAGTCDLVATTIDDAIGEAEEMIQGGDYPIEGCLVYAYVMEVDCVGDEIDNTRIEVEVEPRHDVLIRRVMGDTGCGLSPDDHDWDSSVAIDGGCRENPGVFSRGGTTMLYRDHCGRCGLRREMICHGDQRNHGQADSVEYLGPEEGR